MIGTFQPLRTSTFLPAAWTQGNYTYQVVKRSTELTDGQTNTWFTCRVKDPHGTVYELGSIFKRDEAQRRHDLPLKRQGA